jgi:mannose-6-phosphate isomerase-like protein (cupin superfamily)
MSIAETQAPATAARTVDFSKTPQPSVFKIKVPLLESGCETTPLVKADDLWLLVRVYAPKGGENALHAHRFQTHSFIVLHGQARFHGARGEVWDLGKNEGIILPAGAYYQFENSGEDSLVVLRIGARGQPGDLGARVGPGGEQIDPYSKENHRDHEVVRRPGQYYE